MHNRSRARRLYRAFILLLLASLLPVAPMPATPLAAAPTEPELVFLDAVAPRLATLPTGIAGMMAAAVPTANETSQIYLMGGYQSETAQGGGLVKTLARDIYRYDAALDELAIVDELPAGLALAAHVYVPTEGLIYLFGGIAEDGNGQPVAVATIQTYRPATGEVTTLAASLPAARARATAVYVAALQQIFIVGGVSGSDPNGAPLAPILTFDLATQTLAPSGINLPTDDPINRWGAAYYINETAPLDAELPASVTAPYIAGQLTNYILVLGTHATFLFSPSTGQTLTLNEVAPTGVLAAASAFVPTRMRIWSAGGFDTTADGTPCYSWGVQALDPRLYSTDPQVAGAVAYKGGIATKAQDAQFTTQTQNDGAAIYLPALDRVFLFGGFVAQNPPDSATCLALGTPGAWEELPDPGQYSSTIYSISPVYQDEDEWTTRPAPSGSSAPPRETPVSIASLSTEPSVGNPVTLTFTGNTYLGADFSGPETREYYYAVYLQTAFRVDGERDEVQNRFLAMTTNAAELTVTIPKDLAPGPDRRIVAFCLVNTWRLTPPNCRESAVTLRPGSITGTVVRAGNIPVAGAMVELRDYTGELLDRQQTNAQGQYAFCNNPPGQTTGVTKCLAIGDYSLDIWKDFDRTERIIYVPMRDHATVPADDVIAVTAMLDTTPIEGPTIKTLQADLGMRTSGEIGTFMSFTDLTGVATPAVINGFTVETLEFTPPTATEPLPTQKVTFELNGDILIGQLVDVKDPGAPASETRKGWRAEFDMSKLAPGPNTLRVTAYDDGNVAGAPRDFTINAIAAKPLDASWVFAPYGVTWDRKSESYTLRALMPKIQALGTTLRWPTPPAAYPHVVDIAGLVNLYSQARADLEITETYNINGRWDAEGNGAILLQILSFDPDEFLVVENFEVTPTYQDKLLFNVSSSFINELNTNEQLSDELRAQFSAEGHPLSAEATVEVEQEDSRWVIRDTDQRYIIFRENQRLDVYELLDDQGIKEYRVQSRAISLCEFKESILPEGLLKEQYLAGKEVYEAAKERKEAEEKKRRAEKEKKEGVKKPKEKKKKDKNGKAAFEEVLSLCGEWIPLFRIGGPEISVFGATVRPPGIGVEGMFDGKLWLQGSINGKDWRFDELRIVPRAEVSAKAEASFELDVIFVTAGAGVAVVGKLTFDQPIAVVLDPEVKVRADKYCFKADVDAKIWAAYEIDFGLWSEGDSWEEKLPYDLHYQDGDCRYAPAGLLAANTDDALSPRVVEPATRPPNVMPAPAAAVASDGSAMRLWVEETTINPDAPDAVLMYEFTDGGGNQQRGVVSENGHHDPVVTFLGTDKALAVWTEVTMPPGMTPTGIADLLAHQELYAATWERSTNSWSTPARLTVDQLSDGRPQLAAGAGGKALLVWARDGDGNHETRGDLQIVARQWHGSGWDAPQVIADDPQSSDAGPAVAYAPDGATAWVTWIRDHDADYRTSGDRRLNYAIWNGSSWSTAVEPASWPTGVIEGTLTFSSRSDKPLVAMTALHAQSGASEAAISADAMRLYAAWWGPAATAWDVQSLGGTRGEWPQAMVYTDNHALIMLRSFGGGELDGAANTSGQIGVAAGLLGDASAHWAPPGVLTEDEETLWQLAAVTLPANSSGNANGMVSFTGVRDVSTIRNTTQRSQVQASQAWAVGAVAPITMIGDRQARILGGNATTGIFGFSDGMAGIDPLIKRVTLSNPLPAPGEIVTATVEIYNDELRPMGSTGDNQLRVALRRCEPIYSCETRAIANATYNGELLFNETISLTLPYRSSGRPEYLDAILFTHPNDLDTSNNRLELMAGRITDAPQMVRASAAAGRVDVSWRPPVSVNPFNETIRYWVYRAPDPTGPWTLLGQSIAPSYADIAPADGSDVYYAVRAADGRQHLSELSAAATTKRHTPTANDDTAFTDQDAPVRIDVLQNDLDLDDDLLTVVAVSQPGHGTVTNEGARVIYAPTPGYTGVDSFTYTIADGVDGSATATVGITVNPARPQLSINDVTVSRGTGVALLTVTASRVAAVDLTVDYRTTDDSARAGQNYSATSGTAIIRAGNSTTTISVPILNDPAQGDTKRFFVFLSNPHNASVAHGQGLVTVTDTAVANQSPSAVDDQAMTTPGVAVTINVTANDSDADGDTLTVAILTQPVNGTATVSNNQILYTPRTGFTGVDSFTYRVSDGKGGEATATVTVTVGRGGNATERIYLPLVNR